MQQRRRMDAGPANGRRSLGRRVADQALTKPAGYGTRHKAERRHPGPAPAPDGAVQTATSPGALQPMSERSYLMESEEEAIRLDVKTDGRTVEEHARWAGLRPGMRVADFGCGSGKTTFHLNQVVQPGGRGLGVDMAAQRIDFARAHYEAPGLEFRVKDIREPLDELGLFDFIWVRFVLEYYRAQSFDMVRHFSAALKPGGTLCLVDLDCNCLRFHGFPLRLERAVQCIMARLEERLNFDPYVGIKLYSFLYDLGFENIQVMITPHNLISGKREVQLEQKSADLRKTLGLRVRGVRGRI
jgi:SAM-dependent methyltransferase